MFTILQLLNSSICGMGLFFFISFLSIGLKTLSSTCCFHLDSCNSCVFGVFAFASKNIFVVLIFLHPNMISLSTAPVIVCLSTANSWLYIISFLLDYLLSLCFFVFSSYFLTIFSMLGFLVIFLSIGRVLKLSLFTLNVVFFPNSIYAFLLVLIPWLFPCHIMLFWLAWIQALICQ